MVTESFMPQTAPWMDQKTRDRGAVNINDIYWKRSDKEENAGWLLIGPSAEPGPDGRPLTRQAEAWMRKGRTPLLQYSYTDRVYKNGERHTIETSQDRLNTEWRWYWLFKNGGAHLFPIDQIVTYHWHVNPPYGLPRDVFPQLAEYDVPEPKWCAACPGTRPPKNSDEELVTHLMVSHRMAEPQARELLKYASQPPAGSLGLQIRRKSEVIEQQAVDAGSFPMIEPSGEPPVQPSKHICNFCGSEAKSLAGKMAHERSCKARPQGESGDQAEQVPVAPEEE